jgi:hypothetical protein
MSDDEYSLEEESPQGVKPAQGKSMKLLYKQLEEGPKKENKSRKIKKEKE